MTRLRLAIIGIDHYHSTGWVESLEQFPDEIEIVALYDPDPTMAQTLAPRFHDPSLSAALAPRYLDLPCYHDLESLLRRERLDLALVTLQNRDAPPAIERLAAVLTRDPPSRRCRKREPW